ncbi:MAG: MFS transporter [Candidatus Methanoplasma sp.]|jgi:EmrB/QacA subfamily drug resistance transporter|nr:MFS transporter [Candidatus Methanoplasma sp.]
MGASNRNSTTMILLVVAFAAIVDGIDGSIVNVALPTLARDFGTDMGTISWITVIYFLMLAGLLISFARVASNGAIRKVLATGMVLFTVSSLLCGLSDNFTMLMVFRAAQGIGAAMLGAAAPMICVRYVPAERMGLAMGVLIMGWSIGFATGPGIGGVIIDLLSWHWAFFINIPIGIFALFLIFRAIPKDGIYSKEKLDLVGAALLFAAVTAGTIALELSSYSDDSFSIYLSAILCVVLLAGFVIAELRKKSPLFNVRVFKHWRFDFVFVAFLGINITYLGMFYLLPFYMEVCMGFQPSVAGLYLLLPPLITVILCVPIAKWSDRTQRRWFCIASCVAQFAGSFILVIFARDAALLPLLATLISLGLVWALCGGPMASRVVETIEDESPEMGSSLMYEAVYLGGTIGAALFAMLFAIGAGSGGVDYSSLGHDVFVDGFVFAMIISSVLAVVITILSFLVKERSSTKQL